MAPAPLGSGLQRLFVGTLRLELFLVSLSVAALFAPMAVAALKKYDMARQNLNHYSNSSPGVHFNTAASPGSIALVDDSGANPLLAKYVLTSTSALTTQVPSLTNGFIWFNQNTSEGFTPSTGTGSTTASINWGNLDGWTISGTIFCHGVPSYICDLASGQDSETTDPLYLSSNYDMGTWTFHGTGWTMNLGYINRTSPLSTGPGNLQYVLRGARVRDGTVSALPLLGIGAVALGVFALGFTRVGRRPGELDQV